MSRSIQILTLIILSIVLVGCLIMPNNPIFWLATATPTYTIVRALLIFLLYTFLLFGVPQNAIIKRVIAALALTLVGWALVTTYNETTQLLDGLTFAAAGVALTLSALEPDYANRAGENWGVIASPFKPSYKLVEKRAGYYAMVAFMLFDLRSQVFQVGQHIKHLVSLS